MDIVADLAILDIRAAIDPAPGSNPGPALELGVGPDDRILTDGHVFVKIDRLGVFQSHPAGHPLFTQLLLFGVFHSGQILPGIHPAKLSGVLCQHRSAGQPSPHGLGHDIGQIVLGLRIVRPQGAQGGKQKRGLHTIDARVDLIYLPFLGGRVAGFHNSAQPTVRRPHHPTVIGRVGHPRCEDRHGRPRRPVVVNKAGQGRRGQQRRIAAHDQDLSLPVNKRQLGGQHRIAGAALLGLDGKPDIRTVTRLPNRVGLVADDDDQALGVQPPDGMDDVRHQGFTRHAVQDLGLCRTHSLAQAGSENDNAELTILSDIPPHP